MSTPALSHDFASSLNTIANWVLVFSLCLGVVSTWLIVWTGSVKESYLRTSLSEANKSAEIAKAEAAKANLEAEKAKLEREKIKKELAWRTITPEQVEAIRASFPVPHPKLKIWLQYFQIDPEALTYAQQIGNAINFSDFEIQPTAFLAWNAKTGISISPNEGSEFLFRAFEAAGIKVKISQEYPTGSATGQIVLQVGSKPTPIFDLE